MQMFKTKSYLKKKKLYQRRKHRMPHKKMDMNGMLHWRLNLEAAIWSPLPTLRTFKLSEKPKFQRINFTRVTTNLSKHYSIPTSSQALISIFFSHLSPQSAKKFPENNGLKDSHYLLAPSLLPPPGEVQPLPQDRRLSERASHSFPQAGRGSSPSPAGGCRGASAPLGWTKAFNSNPDLFPSGEKILEKKKQSPKQNGNMCPLVWFKAPGWMTPLPRKCRNAFIIY